MAEDVFPQRNLPPDAENWGREVENRIEGGEASELQLSQKLDNGLRSTAGQLAVVSSQMTELTERLTLANVLFEETLIPGNGSGDARNYWSPYEFTITKPRGVVLDTTMFASLTVATGDFGTFVPIVGVEVVPGLINTLNRQYGVGGNITRTTAGTTFGTVESKSYLRLQAGHYKIWAGALISTTDPDSSATMIQGISTLIIGQPIPENSQFDI